MPIPRKKSDYRLYLESIYDEETKTFKRDETYAQIAVRFKVSTSAISFVTS